jgi:hypothetical protein
MEVEMGLGLVARARLRKRSIFDFAAAPIEQEELLAAFRSCLDGTPLQPLSSSEPLDDGAPGFSFTVHPAEEPVEVTLAGDHAIVSAKTSSAGPGYHAFLVSCLDQIEEKFGIKWDWSGDGDEDDAGGDETGYALSRDFAALQAEMAGFLKRLFSMLSEKVTREDVGKWRIAMPIDFDVETGEGEILTQLGPLAFDEIEAIANSDAEALERAAHAYFPWWGEGFGADFYRGLALNAMWMRIGWSAPADDEEWEEIERVLGWCAEAERLGAEPALPAEAVRELRQLLETVEPSRLPAEHGIGYRRRLMRRALTGGWRVQVPGSLWELMEDGDSTVVFWNNELTVRGSSLIARRKAEAPKDIPYKVKPRVEFAPDKAGEGWVLTTVAETSGDDGTVHVGILTVWMEREELRPVAERIAQSLEYLPQPA